MPNPPKLGVGPMRDLIAKLVDADDAGVWLDTQHFVDRTGVPFTVTRPRLEGLVEQGLAQRRDHGGIPAYRGTLAARVLL